MIKKKRKQDPERSRITYRSHGFLPGRRRESAILVQNSTLFRVKRQKRFAGLFHHPPRVQGRERKSDSGKAETEGGKGKERESTAGFAREGGSWPSEEAGQVVFSNEVKGTHEWQLCRPEFCEGIEQAAPRLCHAPTSAVHSAARKVRDSFLHVRGQHEQSKYVRRHGIDPSNNPIINNVHGHSDSSFNSFAIPDMSVLAFIRKSSPSDRKKQL